MSSGATQADRARSWTLGEMRGCGPMWAWQVRSADEFMRSPALWPERCELAAYERWLRGRQETGNPGEPRDRRVAGRKLGACTAAVECRRRERRLLMSGRRSAENCEGEYRRRPMRCQQEGANAASDGHEPFLPRQDAPDPGKDARLTQPGQLL